MEKYLIWIFVLIVLLNEILLKYSGMIGGMMYLLLITMTLILISRQEVLDDFAKMVIIFLIIPLVRISGLFMDVSSIWKIFLGSLILLFLGIFYMVKFDLDIGEFDKFLWAIPFVVGMGTIVGIFSGGVGIEKNIALIMVLPFVVFSEEIFFRGLFQNSIEKSYGTVYSVLFPAIFYGILSSHFGIGLAVFFFFLSLVSGMLYLSTRNIFLSIIFNLVVGCFIFIIPKLI